MKKIRAELCDITGMKVDAIVNAANEHLTQDSGLCGSIFYKAGARELQEECNKIGFCETGNAVITKGYKLPAKYIIHTVGPIYRGHADDPVKLGSCYRKSLDLAKEYKIHSIAFPALSTGLFDYPLKEATDIAVEKVFEWVMDNDDYDIEIIFACIDSKTLDAYLETLDRTEKNLKNKISENKAEKKAAKKEEKAEKKALKEAAREAIIEAEYEVHQAERNEKTEEYADRKVILFQGPDDENGYLSNWYVSPFMINGITYNSVEQYMMHEKAKCFGDFLTADKILEEKDPVKQQQLGRSVAPYLDGVWNGMRQIVVYSALMAKFGQNYRLREKLLETRDAFIGEASETDRVWGTGIRRGDDGAEDIFEWKGHNLLGYALMQVREDLKK